MTDTSFSCKKCKNKTCLKTKRPCEAIEKLLPGVQTGRLKGEVSLSPAYMDGTLIWDDKKKCYIFTNKKRSKKYSE